MSSPVTLKDLAQLLGLAPSTVSKALKGHPDISKATQEKVKALAEHFHYQPSALAWSLRKQRSCLLAVIIPSLPLPFYAEAVSGIIQFAYEEGYKVIVYEHLEQYEREAEICFSLEKSGIDGVLVVPARTTERAEHFHKLVEAHIPFVFWERWVGEFAVDRVLEDDYNGAYAAVSHLIEQGCRRIAHLALPQSWVEGQKRQYGYIQALLDHHMPLHREWIVEYRESTEIEGIVERLMQTAVPDGWFVATDTAALSALQVLKRLGYRLPQQVAVCGFGNTPFTAVTCPALTTVDRKAREIGKKAAELLIRRLNGEEEESGTYLLKNELVVRESTLFCR